MPLGRQKSHITNASIHHFNYNLEISKDNIILKYDSCMGGCALFLFCSKFLWIYKDNKTTIDFLTRLSRFEDRLLF